MWLWLDVYLVLLNGDVLVGVVAFDSVCVWGGGRGWLCVKSGQGSCCLGDREGKIDNYGSVCIGGYG